MAYTLKGTLDGHLNIEMLIPSRRVHKYVSNEAIVVDSTMSATLILRHVRRREQEKPK